MQLTGGEKTVSQESARHVVGVSDGELVFGRRATSPMPAAVEGDHVSRKGADISWTCCLIDTKACQDSVDPADRCEASGPLEEWP